MKYMKLGNLPDAFYTEEPAGASHQACKSCRTVFSTDVATDLDLQVGNVRYHLHKFPVMLKCGLLQRRACSSNCDSGGEFTGGIVRLDEIPGGQRGFEICAKFCYGISVKISARNFVPAICAARFLRMTESVAKGNLVTKLESFFDTCILQGWKDSIVVLQETRKAGDSWSEKLAIANRCIDAILRKIHTHTTQVTWSYTYTRPGSDRKLVSKDWWTEDVADLNLEHFSSIISSLRSSNRIPSPLIGEALHVYTCKHLLDPDPDPSSDFYRLSGLDAEESITNQRCILESIVSMIPSEYGSVSGRFFIRLVIIANFVGASPSTKAELVRRAGRQLHEVNARDLLFASPLNPESYDMDMVEEVLEIFLIQFRRLPKAIEEEEAEEQEVAASKMLASMIKVAKTIDSYLQIISHKPDIPVARIVQLAKSLPDLARPEHDQLYRAIDIYLKNHPNLSKSEKKQLCQMIDARKLSHDVCSHIVGNDQLPLRTIVQVLFVEQEKAAAYCNRPTPLSSKSVGLPMVENTKPESESKAMHKKELGRARNTNQ